MVSEKMTDAAWKRAERKVAKALNGKRIPINGRAGPDVVAPGLGVEVKYRRTLPKWLKEALQQARDGAEGDSVPLVALCERGSRVQYVLMALSDFKKAAGIGEQHDGP